MNIILFLVWIVCGVMAAGLTYATFVREFPILDSPQRRAKVAGFAALFGILGPIGLLVAFFCGGFGFYGFLYPGQDPWTGKWKRRG